METDRLILPILIVCGSFTQDFALQILPSRPQEVLSDLHPHFYSWSLDFSWTAAGSRSFPEISKPGETLFSSGATPNSFADGKGKPPELSDESIALFLDIAQELNAVPSAVRANALGIFQANVGIWQILARQGQILSPHLNDSWQQVIKPFATIR